MLEQSARRHFLLHLAICLPLAELAFCSRELIGWDESKIWDLLAGLSTMSTAPARRLAQLAAIIAARPALQEILDRKGPEAIDRLVAADESFAQARLAVRMEVQPLKSTQVTFPVLRRILQQQLRANMTYIKDAFSRRGEKALP